MHGVKEHIIFYKWDVLERPRKNCPRNCKPGPGSSPRAPCHPTHHNWCWRHGDTWCHSLIVQTSTPSLFRPPPEETPPVKPIASPTVDDVGHTLPGLGNPLLEGDATVLSTKPEMEDWPAGQDASPSEAVTQLVPTTASVVELTSPIIPYNQTEEERWFMLVVTATVRRLNLEATCGILGDTVTASAGGLAFQNPQMAAVVPGPVRERRAIGNQGTAVEELARKDAEWECP